MSSNGPSSLVGGDVASAATSTTPATTATAPSSSSSAASGAAAVGSSAASPIGPAIWDYNHTLLQGWIQKAAPLHVEPTLAVQLWAQLKASLDSLQETVQRLDAPPKEVADDNNNDTRLGQEPPPTKRRKKIIVIRTLRDPNHLWLPAWKECPTDGPTRVLESDTDDIPTCAGGKLSQLTLGGTINALAGVVGGITHQATPSLISVQKITLPPSDYRNPKIDVTVVYEAAARLHRACATRIQADVLRTTPLRIQEMLAADLTPQEFAATRKRIVDTVVRGKGRAIVVDEDSDDLIVAPPVVAANSQSTAEKYQKCNTCGNIDQSTFVMDRKNGDIICSNCGTVVAESLMHEGSAYRKFEGEADRNHHGDTANPLFSNAQNMSTTLGGTMTTMTRGMGGKSNLETILRNAHAYTELNLSNFGKTDRRTRTGYKDKQKKDAFIQMAHVGDALNLHEAVIQRAKELFAGFRDDRELVQQFKGVIGACLSIAFEQLSEEGKAILRSTEQAEATTVLADDSGKAKPLSSRAARRSQLHHANLAGKGGLMLDFSNMEQGSGSAPVTATAANGTGATTSPKASDKPASTWDLLDCRSWLLDASRRIAQHWVDERSQNTPTSKDIPPGTLEELEGQLVEHSITLCEQLEKELTESSKQRSLLSQKKVVTPRVTDMSKLGIKWQHSHERGSGGKGGVGGSGTARTVPSGPSRSAGQILLLKTAKRLGEILNDPFAGAAIHKELRGLVSQQEARKQKLMREEASRQRLQQMRRKPWLQARIQA